MFKQQIIAYYINNILQRYFWFKKNGAVWTPERPFPVDIEYLLRDTIESLRPKLHICENYEEALKEAEELDNEFKAKLGITLIVFCRYKCFLLFLFENVGES